MSALSLNAYHSVSREVQEFAKSHDSRKASLEHWEKEIMKSRLEQEKRMEQIMNRSPLDDFTKMFTSDKNKTSDQDK